MSVDKKTRSTSQVAPIKKQIRKYSKDSDFESSSDSEDSEQFRKKRFVKLWKPEEDELLQKYYSECQGNWNLIVQFVPGRNVSQCSQRWKRINPNRVKLRKQWTEEEDAQVLKLINKYGRNWKRIETEMQGRSGKQIRERFINKLDKTINHDYFSEKEDTIIYQQYQQLGPKWSEISKHLQGRPENMVKNRFYSHIRKQYNIEVAQKHEDDSFEEEQAPEPIQQLFTIQSTKDDLEVSLPLPPSFSNKKESSDILFGAYNRQYSSLYKQQQEDVKPQFDSFGSNQGLWYGSKLHMSLEGGDKQEIFQNIMMPMPDSLFGLAEESRVDTHVTNGNSAKMSLNQKMQQMSLESNKAE